MFTTIGRIYQPRHLQANYPLGLVLFLFCLFCVKDKDTIIKEENNKPRADSSAEKGAGEEE